MTKSITQKEACTGCGACVNICPKKCIKMSFDKTGFEYPKIDLSVCINCNKCSSVCPINKSEEIQSKPIAAYGGYNKDKGVIEKSASGGFFYTIAKNVLLQGGAVYGAAYSDDFYSVNHICVTEVDELYRLQRSKYVQSSTDGTFSDVKNRLDKGQLVLFSGTPCQIGGLKAFLGKEYDNLIMIDVICHGVPSPEIWKKYLMSLEKEYDSKAVSVNFRYKRMSTQGFAVGFESGNEYYNELSCDNYGKAFFHNYILRDSCYQCAFKNNQYYSDITLGDFWGVEKKLPEIKNQKGTSCCIVRTKKGQELVDGIKDDFIFSETLISDIAEYNQPLNYSYKKPASIKLFHKMVKKGDIRQGMESFFSIPPSRMLYLEDIETVKRDKGKLYSILYAIKHIKEFF